MTYKYITQETIDSGGKNIKSPEEFQEARIYNMEAVKNYNKRHKVHAAFNIWIIVQYVLLFWKFTIVLLGMTATSSAGLTNWRIALGAIGLISYLGLVTYFVFIRGCRDKFILGLVSMPVALVSLVFLTFPLGNFTAALYYSHVENELSKELGYPSFPRLNVTTFNTDADNLSELTYDSIREKINRDHPHDGTFL
jgi:hypothetical protein